MSYEIKILTKIAYAAIQHYIRDIKQEKVVYDPGFHDANGDGVHAEELSNHRSNYNRLVRIEKKYERILRSNFIQIIFPESKELYNIQITRLLIKSLIVYEAVCLPIFKCYEDYKSICEKKWRELPQEIQCIYYDCIDEIKKYQEIFETDRVSEIDEIFNFLKNCRYNIIK